MQVYRTKISVVAYALNRDNSQLEVLNVAEDVIKVTISGIRLSKKK